MPETMPETKPNPCCLCCALRHNESAARIVKTRGTVEEEIPATRCLHCWAGEGFTFQVGVPPPPLVPHGPRDPQGVGGRGSRGTSHTETDERNATLPVPGLCQAKRTDRK